MEEKEIPVRANDGTMTTFIAHPDSGGPFPVALLFMDGVGYREQIKENARLISSQGVRRGIDCRTRWNYA